MNASNQFGPLQEGYISLSDHDPDSSPDAEMQSASDEPPDHMDVDCSFPHFARCLTDSSLPGEPDAAGPFDMRFDFELGDPGANFEGTCNCGYATSGAKGEPHWPRLFLYLLSHFNHVRTLSTVFVLVDNRDLTAPKTEQESLAHWPTVEAWWVSRLAMHGPAKELCDLLFVPISQSAGLEHVHPTWAGTFVLAALVFLFPGVHVVLLDSDCVPITLFEVADLWKEISLVQNGLTGFATCGSSDHSKVTEESAAKASKISPRWQSQVIGQGALLVTEHNAEFNAGFIVAFASSHRAPIQEDRWVRISNASHSPQNHDVLQTEANLLAASYWDYVGAFLNTRRPLEEISAKECAAWVQSGLALTPFSGCVTKYTCDWTVAWSLIGEWTSSEIFLPPKGEWRRNGHPRNLLDDYANRSPPILTWARACFEQGSLPSMLSLAGEALLSVLPGDRMFQSQRLTSDCARPVILHGYGGAKRDIPRSLSTIASEGWVPFAHGMLGYLTKAPAWCTEDLRPVVGTSCDFRIKPDPLTHREQLLLSMWRRIRVPCLPNQCALRTWLANKLDIPLAPGPDHVQSPHADDKEVDYEPLFKGLAMQAATVAPAVGATLAPTKEQLLALRAIY